MYCLKIYHSPPDGGEGHLATILYPQYVDVSDNSTTQFYTDPHHELQVGLLRRVAGADVVKHTHRPAARTVLRTSEVLLFRTGRALIRIYSSQGEYAGGGEVHAGVIVIFHEGGHEIEITEDCEIVEVKQGPFLNDKVLL